MERCELSRKELARYSVIENTIEGYLKADQAAEELHLSRRQIFRLKRKLKKKGIEGLIHGNRGRPSYRRTKDYLRDTIDYLYRGKYDGFNISHFTEMLEERERIFISRETVRGILLEKGSYEKKKRYPKHRSFREPMPKEDMMLQFDTSDHDWLQGRGPKIKLIGGIDDATKDVPWAKFALKDSVEENMATSKEIIKRKGIPLSLYVDKDSKFITTRHGGLHVNIKKDQEKTQMQRAWEELGINVIYAESPQGMDLDQIFSMKEERRVQGDNTINYKAKLYQILPTKTRFGFAKAKVEVQKHLDGTIHIFYKGEELPFKPIIPLEHQQYAPSQKEALPVGV